MRKTARKKLYDDKDLPKVVSLDADAQRRWGGRTLVIAAPRQVDAAIRKIRRGQTITVTELRKQLAQDAGADVACPLTTGIFARLAAEAAEEDAAAGKSKITPWWRVLTSDGKPNPKFPGGGAEQRRRLADEGVILPEPRVRKSKSVG